MSYFAPKEVLGGIGGYTRFGGTDAAVPVGPPASLMAHWTLDELSGTRYDSLGNYDLTDNNTVGVSLHGPVGDVANFVQASSESLQANNFPASVSATRTYAGWIQAKVDTGGANQGVFVDYDAGGGGYLSLRWGPDAAGSRVLVSAQGHPAGGGFINSGTVIVHRTFGWHFFVLEFNPTAGTLNLRVDGVYTGEQSSTAGTWPATTSLYLGQNEAGFSDTNQARYAVYDGALTVEQADSLFNSGTAKDYADLTAAEKVGLISYFEGKDTSDSHGSNTLTNNNGVTFVENVTVPLGNAASVVGANLESLSVTTNDFRMSGDFSVGLWVYPQVAPAGDASVIETIDGASTDDWTLMHAAFTYNFFIRPRDSVSGAPKATVTLSQNTWYFLCVRYNSTTKVAYISANGGAEQSTTALANGLRQLSTSLRIGNPGNGQQFLVDEVSFFTINLSADQIAYLYGSGVPPAFPFAGFP